MDAIVVDNISKVFKLHENPVHSVKERMLSMGRSKYREFVALEPMSLSISTGTTLGILGHNGSGKSTLLKVVSGILKPTTGQIRLRGRLASLLELGAGFHPELTGRENVYINAAFLGISRKEIEKRFDDIVEFSELDQFIDEPVKHYSSGMYVRLGFAVAVNLDPDVLLVDEVLAVGDEVFQRKCLDRVRQFQQEGRTIVVVTHAADVVRQVCQRAIVLDHGKLVADGAPGDAIRIFREHLHGTLEEAAPQDTDTGPLKITDVRIHHPRSAERKYLEPGEPLTIEVSYATDRTVEAPTLSISILSLEGQAVFALDLDLPASGISNLHGSGTITVPFTAVPLLDGRYTLSLRLTDRHDADLRVARDGRDEFEVLNPGAARGVAALTLGTVSSHA
ncbi:MAG: ABC transporter ATP-binding protein [Actinomycetota bacterium]|nr:ABC transporter ATP-binding protein [Actinomycetota bacterium]